MENMEGEDPLAGEITVRARLDQSGLAVQTKSRAIAALDRLVGSLIDIPGALAEGVSRSRRLKTQIREELELSLARAKIEGASEIERLRQRSALYDEARKLEQQSNRETTAALALEDLRTQSTETDEPGILSDDWLNKYARLCEDVSSDEVRRVVAKILSGEIRRPGSFSPTTLRIVGELTQELAEDFAWAWNKSIGNELWRGPEFNSGEPWTKLRNLRDAGLLSPVDAAIHQPPFQPLTVPALGLNDNSIWQIGPKTDIFLWIAMTEQANVRLNVVNFTRVGLELGPILPIPDYENNLRSLSAGFPKRGVAWIKLSKVGKQEVLWSAG